MLNKFADFLFFKITSIAGYVYASLLGLILVYGLFVWLIEGVTSFLMVEITYLSIFFVLSFFTLFITDFLIILFLILKKEVKHKNISKGKDIANKTMFLFYILLSLGLKLFVLLVSLFPDNFTNIMNSLGEKLYQFSYNETWKELTNCTNGCKLPQH